MRKKEKKPPPKKRRTDGRFLFLRSRRDESLSGEQPRVQPIAIDARLRPRAHQEHILLDLKNAGVVADDIAQRATLEVAHLQRAHRSRLTRVGKEVTIAVFKLLELLDFKASEGTSGHAVSHGPFGNTRGEEVNIGRPRVQLTKRVPRGRVDVRRRRVPVARNRVLFEAAEAQEVGVTGKTFHGKMHQVHS